MFFYAVGFKLLVSRECTCFGRKNRLGFSIKIIARPIWHQHLCHRQKLMRGPYFFLAAVTSDAVNERCQFCCCLNKLRGLAEAHLQIKVAFLPGHVSASHVQTVAKHLTDCIADLSIKVGLTDDYAGKLTALLGVRNLFVLFVSMWQLGLS